MHSAMPAVRAERLCPHAIFVAPDFTRYRAVSQSVREIFKRHTDMIEPLSLDEAYLDVTKNKTGLGVPICFHHNADHIFYIGVRDARLEEVTHAVDEDGLGARPLKRFGELLRHEVKIEALFVGVAFDAAEALCKGLGVTVLAAGADFGAAPKRVPRRVGPLDL